MTMKNGSSDGQCRDCGYGERELFDFLDGALPVEAARTFERHLAACAACRQDVAAYGSLAQALDDLPALEADAGFDRAVLDAALGAPAAEPVVAGRKERLAGRLSRRPLGRLPVYAGLTALLGFLVMATVVIHAAATGGVDQLADQAIVRVVHSGVDLLAAGTRQVLAAVKLSDVMLRLAVILGPVLRSLTLVANAVRDEFWIISTIVSLLALLGAVRLATGSAVERGIRRVSLFV